MGGMDRADPQREMDQFAVVNYIILHVTGN